MKRERKIWHRWLMLATAVIDLIIIWRDIQSFHRLSGLAIFSREQLEVLAADTVCKCLDWGLLAAVLLFQFFTWNLSPSKKTSALLNSILCLALLPLWLGAGVLAPMRLWSVACQVSWFVILAVLAGGGVYSAWTYHKLKQPTFEQ